MVPTGHAVAIRRVWHWAGWRTSNAYRTYAADAASPRTLGDGEQVVELYYRWRMAKQFELTPSVQFITQPGSDTGVNRRAHSQRAPAIQFLKEQEHAVDLICGSGVDGARFGQRPGAGRPTFNLTIRDGHFIPTTLEVPANTKFRLLIKNEGPGAEEFESIELRKEKVLAPGATSFLIFQPLKPGTYPFFGDFHPQTAQGKIVAK